MEKAIIIKNLTKKYKLYNNSNERLLDTILPNKYGKEFEALSKVNFVANKGETIGFAGINGSGKSTLSNIIAGIVPETSGTIEINGEVSLIAVAAGLKNDLTGRDNIELKLLMLGFNKKEIKDLEQDIIDFSELGDFIDQPVKLYSSGMKSRLGFAISVNVDPEILIIDEALSVGDNAFAEKSLAKMKEFKKKGKTMIFVSHSINQMKMFCDKILWLEYGRVKEYGTVGEIIPKYENFIKVWKMLTKEERVQYRKNILDDCPQLNESIMNKNKIGSKPKEIYIEKPVSYIGRMKRGNAYVYENPKDLTNYTASEDYKKQAFYIKRQANVNGEIFYLISTVPSATREVIGWVKKSRIIAVPQILIDEDHKILNLTGEGSAYDMPWGKELNTTYSELEQYKEVNFYVERTELISKTIWYFGVLNGEKVWISSKFILNEL